MALYEESAHAASRTDDTRPIKAVGIDPRQHPIIAQHFFGIEPFRPIGKVAAEVVADLKFRRQVLRLHRRGPRVIAELLAELGAERSIMTLIDGKLERYAALNPEALGATGGDQFWPAPLHKVPRT